MSCIPQQPQMFFSVLLLLTFFSLLHFSLHFFFSSNVPSDSTTLNQLTSVHSTQVSWCSNSMAPWFISMLRIAKWITPPLWEVFQQSEQNKLYLPFYLSLSFSNSLILLGRISWYNLNVQEKQVSGLWGACSWFCYLLSSRSRMKFGS